jgi:hypothetical protein
MEGLRKEQLIDFPSDSKLLKEIKEILSEFGDIEDRIDQLVRKKIQSLSRPVPPGSREWEILYRKYFEQELMKQRG